MIGTASSAAVNQDPAKEAGPTVKPSEHTRRVLFVVGHPAQVHLFRNAILELQQQGHETFVASRKKEDTVALLDAYGLEHEPLSKRGNSLSGLLVEQALREKRLLALAREFRPDVIVSRLSPAAAHVSALLGCRNVVLTDTEFGTATLGRLNARLTLPFVDTVCAPENLDIPIGAPARRPMTVQELAYLHPQYFSPDPFALGEFGIDLDTPYYVLRLSGWDAYHDVGHAGLSADGVRELVAFLSHHGTVYISAEGDLPEDLAGFELPTPPEYVHDVLYYADLYVGDSGTMSTEAAVLGTPAVRTNSMVGPADEPVFGLLEEEYGLLQSFADEDRAIMEVKRLVTEGPDRAEWHRRREALVAEHPNVTEQLVEIILEQ